MDYTNRPCSSIKKAKMPSSVDYNKLAILSAAHACKQLLLDMAHTVGLQDHRKRLTLFMLDPALGMFIGMSDHWDFNINSFAPNEISDVRQLIGSTFGKFSEAMAYRGEQVVAIVFCEGDIDLSMILEEHLAAIPFVYNRRNTERLVNSLNSPVPYHAEPREFFSALCDVARSSSGTEFGAYRTINGSRLQCLFNWGFKELSSNPEGLTVDSDEIATLKKAIETGKVQYVQNIHTTYPQISQRFPYQEPVMSFCAVPVLVGEKAHGVISFATSFEYDFSPIERQALLCIANAVGVSINNFRLNWEGNTVGAEFERISSSIIGVEVAQSIRHNIFNSAGALITDLSTLEVEVKKADLNKNARDRANRILARAETHANRIQSEIRSMKDVMSVDRTVKLTTVKNLWVECLHHLGHRIDALGVHVSEVKSHGCVPLISDLVKHIFHNLLLNSLDAFEDSSPNLRREISLQLVKNDKKNRTLSLVYRDNGPGLNIAKLEETKRRLSSDLLVRDVNESTPIGELIFRPQVSTKDDGSGFGLWLARRMASYHLGGVEYQTPSDHRGMIFHILLGYDIFKLSEENMNALFLNENGRKIALLPEEFARKYLDRKK